MFNLDTMKIRSITLHKHKHIHTNQDTDRKDEIEFLIADSLGITT